MKFLIEKFKNLLSLADFLLNTQSDYKIKLTITIQGFTVFQITIFLIKKLALIKKKIFNELF